MDRRAEILDAGGSAELADAYQVLDAAWTALCFSCDEGAGAATHEALLVVQGLTDAGETGSDVLGALWGEAFILNAEAGLRLGAAEASKFAKTAAERFGYQREALCCMLDAAAREGMWDAVPATYLQLAVRPSGLPEAWQHPFFHGLRPVLQFAEANLYLDITLPVEAILRDTLECWPEGDLRRYATEAAKLLRRSLLTPHARREPLGLWTPWRFDEEDET